MKISIDLDTAGATDLAALTALVRSLGTKVLATSEHTLPTGETVTAELVSVPADLPEPIAAEAASYPSVPQPEHISSPEGAPDVDSRGLPWDERIHAGTKATNADGSWRNKRGVDKALLDAVEAELRAGVGESASGATVPDAPLGQMAPTPETVPTAPIPDLPSPPVPSASAVPAAPTNTPVATDGAPSFKDAMARVTAGQRDGTVTQQQVAEAAQALGLASVVDLAKPANAHLIEGFIAALG